MDGSTNKGAAQKEEEETKNVDMVDDFDEFDEEDFEINDEGEGNEDDAEFDGVVGELQEIVISEKYESLSQQFFRDNCQVFEDDEENKMEYMPIFKNYEKTIDGYIQAELERRIEGFQMNRFQELLKTRSDQIDEQLLDTLLSFTDFDNFKQLMLDYKRQFLEEARIEHLKTIKSQRKTNEKNTNKSQQKQPNNIFAAQKDPLADLKSFSLKTLEKKQPQGNTNQMNSDTDIIGDEDLKPSFFIDCRQLNTQKQLNKKK